MGFTPKSAGESELAPPNPQLSNFTWLNGSFLLDWLIHNLDVCCWAKNAWPVSAQGQGGRQVRTEPDQLFDHYAVEYTFADGTRMMAQGRHIAGCWGFWGVRDPRREGLGRPRRRSPPGRASSRAGGRPWRLSSGIQGDRRELYQFEHDLLFDGHPPGQALQRGGSLREVGDGRHPRPHGRRVGQEITWDEALASNIELAPGLDAVHDGVESAGDARRPGPLPHRHAGHDQGPLTAR